MQPTKTLPRNRSQQQPPTSWRSPNISQDYIQHQKRPRSSSATSPESLRGVDRSSPRSSYFDQTPRSYRKSNELTIRRHEARDSVLDNILSSFDRLSGGEDLPPKQPPSYSSFKDGRFKLDTPYYIYDAVSQLSSDSPSSIDSPRRNEKENHPISPHQIRKTPPRGSSLPKQRSASTLRRSPTPRARLRQEALAMSASTSPRRNRKGRNSAESLDSASTRSDQVMRSKRRSFMPSGDTPTRQPRSSDRELPNASGLIMKRSPVRQIPYEGEQAPKRPPSPPPRSTFAGPIVPTQNFRPQRSSRNKVAHISGSDAVLASSVRPSMSDVTSMRQFIADTMHTEPPRPASPLSRQASAQPVAETPRKRPGILKRVFGSSSNSITSYKAAARAPSSAKPEDLGTQHTNTSRVDSFQERQPSNGMSELAAGRFTPTESLNDVPINDTHPILQKKTSFFRRRMWAAGKEVPGNLDVTTDEAVQPNAPMLTPSPVFVTAKSSPVAIIDDAELVGPSFAETTIPDQYIPRTPPRRQAEFETENSPHSPHARKRPATAESTRSRHGTTTTTTTIGSTGTTTTTTTTSFGAGNSTAIYSAPMSSLSAQFAAANLDGNESAPSTPARSAITRVEYPASLPTSRNTALAGLAITTDEPVKLPSPYVSSSSVAAAESTDYSPSRPSKRIWIQPDESDEESAGPKRTSRTSLLSQSRQGAKAEAVDVPSTPAMSIPSRKSSISAPLRPIEVPSTPAMSIPSRKSSTPSGRSSSFAPSSAPVSMMQQRMDHGQEAMIQRRKDVDIARKLFYGGELQGRSMAEILGQPEAADDRIRREYMRLLDLEGLDVLGALRQLCEKVTLRAESQQISRILGAFAQRWCECNPNHTLKSEAVVNNIVFALLLLNTDLHLADFDSRMSKGQFISNTMNGIHSALEKTSADVQLGDTTQNDPEKSDPWKSSTRPSLEARTNSEGRVFGRRPSRPMSGIVFARGMSSFDIRNGEVSDVFGPSTPEASMRAWEANVESLLKEFYNSIRQQRLPLSKVTESQSAEQSSSSSLPVKVEGLKRSGSTMTKSGMDNMRGRGYENRIASRWMPRNMSKTKVYSPSTVNSERNSFEDVTSPAASSTWSSTLAKTQTSMSSTSINDLPRFNEPRAPSSIGFAKALNQARMKEERPETADQDKSALESPTIDDEVLMLAGAPWAKEGIVQHKHHVGSSDKKVKERNWVQCFAVVEKGTMRLFSFTSKASSKNQRNKPVKGGVVGGGNWTQSAEALDSFALRQTLAENMPGRKDRQYLFSLRLPSGALHHFEVGTPEIADEFVSTINYWSARLSKEPLMGGISNIEYGWSDAALMAAETHDAGTSGATRPPTSASQATQATDAPSRASFQGTFRSSFELQRSAPAVRLTIWTPPAQNMNPSTLGENEQLNALRAYVQSIAEEVAEHNELKTRIVAAYGTRGQGYSKAMTNWEKKMGYLQSEREKFGRYVEALVEAGRRQEGLRKERAGR